MSKYDLLKKGREKEVEKRPQDVVEFFRKESGETRDFIKKLSENDELDVSNDKITTEQSACIS